MQVAIKACRKRRGISQSELARRIGKSRSLICMYEAGLVNIPVGVLCEIARELRVPIGDMIVAANDEVAAQP